MYNATQDKIQFEKIVKMKDNAEKYYKLSDFMFKVVPYSFYWNKAQAESRRLENILFTGC